MEDQMPEIPESQLLNDPKLRKDLIKLKELQIKFAAINAEKNQTSTPKRGFRWKHFFMYIFPALIQAGTIYAAYLAVVKSKFFEAANYYAEGRTMRLQSQEDSLKIHKSKLYDSIKRYSQELSAQKLEINATNSRNLQLNSLNASLSGEIKGQTKSIHDLDMQYYGTLIDNYSESFSHLKNEVIEKLAADASRDEKHKGIIKTYIDQKLHLKNTNAAQAAADATRFAALGYFCFKSPAYRSLFIKNLKSYSAFYLKEMDDQFYPNQLMNIIRYPLWGNELIDENFSVLFKDASSGGRKNQLAQIASWSTYQVYETRSRQRTKKMPPYWSKQHEFILGELSGALLDQTLVVKDQNFFSYYKGLQLSLLTECPQAYFSLEAEFLKRNFTLFKATNKDRDSVKFTFLARRKGDAAELYDSDITPQLKFSILLTVSDINNYSPQLYETYQKAIDLNHIISFDKLGFSDDTHFEDDTNAFLEYYRVSRDKFSFWLSPENARSSDKSWYQQKVLSLKL